eukprot:scaffold11138_cov111-Isochrysis_galbana.AAC.8
MRSSRKASFGSAAAPSSRMKASSLDGCSAVPPSLSCSGMRIASDTARLTCLVSARAPSMPLTHPSRFHSPCFESTACSASVLPPCAAAFTAAATAS